MLAFALGYVRRRRLTAATAHFIGTFSILAGIPAQVDIMKKFSKIIKDIFTKNIDIKLLALVMAALTVVFINIPTA